MFSLKGNDVTDTTGEGKSGEQQNVLLTMSEGCV